jgi:glycosyltransferase involved in cell wall biosynthesis
MSVLRLPRNSGSPAAPINVGIRAAQGEFIAVLDQDDVLLPEKFSIQTDVLRRCLSVAVVGSLCGILSKSEKVLQSTDLIEFLAAASRRHDDALILDSGPALVSLLLRRNYLFGYPAFMFRRASWNRKGGVDDSFRIASDYEFLCWLCTQGELAILPQVQYLRRLHGSNLSGNLVQSNLEVARVCAKYTPIAARLTKGSHPPPGFREWLVAEAYLARERGAYGQALNYYRLLGALWSWRSQDLLALAKLSVHCLTRPIRSALPRREARA